MLQKLITICALAVSLTACDFNKSGSNNNDNSESNTEAPIESVNSNEAYPKIQNNIWGIELGKSNVQTTSQILKLKGYELFSDTTDPERYFFENCKFGGYLWSMVFLRFNKDRLYSISFMNNSVDVSVEDLIFDAESLRNKLNAKYSQFELPDDSGNSISYCDGDTELSLTYSSKYYDGENVYTLILSYSDVKILLQNMEDADNEL